MRILLVTGKGGVGKTTVAAATAVAAADLGQRTLVASTDPAHSLADAFDLDLGAEPSSIAPQLDGQQIDAQRQLESYWGSIRDQLVAVLGWGGVTGLEAEEFLIFPGMDELFALLEVGRHAKSGQYDTLVVDCAPTSETLRLLSLPEVLSWYFDRILPVERRIMRAARPVLTRVTNLPVPGEEVFDAAENVFSAIEAVKRLLGDGSVTSARLVVNPEKMVVEEARRTYTYLALFGYGVDGVVVNRVLPSVVSDPYFARWHQIQAGHLDTIHQSFPEVPVLPLRLFDNEMIGIDRLREMAAELYPEGDPFAGMSGKAPFRIYDTDSGVTLELDLPFVEREELSVARHGNELLISLGSFRRSFVLPDSLLRRTVARAKLSDGVLRVVFEEENQ